MEKRKQAQNWSLRQARERRGWTQKEVADQIDLLDVRTLRRWEAGEAFPSLRYRARLCELFAMEAEELALTPNSAPLLPTPEDQRHPETPQLSAEERYLSSAFLKSQSMSGREQWNRQQLLKKVYAFWIKGLPGQPLREATYLKLELCACPDMVATPWTQVIQQLNRSMRPLPPDTHITQIYDDACGELLILGEPGAGKTSLLVELARDLLDRASKNEAHPIPVIFNLSSWPLKQQPLTAWLVEELSSKYQVPQQVGLVWVEDDHILPLLDGLDEVSPALRKACIDTINAYRCQHGLVPLVLCSCREEYLELGAQILLQQAIYIQPLTQQHAEDYLANSGDQVVTLQSALHNDTDLQKLITTPLMLNILERMQLDWLPTSRLQRFCLGLFIGVWAGLSGSVLAGFIAMPPEDTMVKALVIAPGLALTIGIIAGIAGALYENILSTALKKGIARVMAGIIIGGCTIWAGNFLGWAANVLAGTTVSVVIILASLLLSRKDPMKRPD